MHIHTFGHSCLLVEQGDGRVLIDPGTFSHGFEQLTGLTAVLITHQHADHLDLSRLPAVVAANPHALVASDAGSAVLLEQHGIEARVLRANDELDLGLSLRVIGYEHAVVHPEIPVVPNVGLLLGAPGHRLFHPGDAHTVPDEPVDVLALPTAAPWTRVREVVDHLRAVRPRLAVPIHDAILRVPTMVHPMIAALAPAGTEFRAWPDDASLQV